MSSTAWTEISNALADTVDRAAASVVQVQGRRRPVSGLVYSENVVVTNARALGSGDGVMVRRGDGAELKAELAGWDPATGLAVLRVNGLEAPAIGRSRAAARVGHFAVALARSWSNAITASLGTVAVIGGPLATGRRRSIQEIIRTTAPMHDGFAGGAFLNTDGELIGVCTPASIRGLGVVIPERIVGQTAAHLLEHGRTRRGYLGIAGQPVTLAARQREGHDREQALLVVGVTAASPAAEAGVLVGDVLLDFDGQPIATPEDLLDLLDERRGGRSVELRLLRGTAVVASTITVGERPAH